MRRTLLSFLLMLIGFAPATAAATEPFACNMKALTREERQRYGVLAGKLHAAHDATREIAEGYEITLKLDHITLREVAEWVEMEARCCPFFTFNVELHGGKQTAALRLT